MSLLIKLAESTHPQDVVDYLGSLGWYTREHPNKRLYVLRRVDKELPPVEFILPRDREAPDFSQRLLEIANGLGSILNLGPSEILFRIREVNADIFRARVIGEVSQENSLPLDIASKIVAGLKKLITYAATAELSPLPFSNRPADKAVEHAQRCRFGHTFPGSFGFTIESPLPPAAQQPLIENMRAEPFERKVVERIYRGIINVRRAVEEHALNAITDNYDKGLNANMCDALLEIAGAPRDIPVAYKVEWSPKFPTDFVREQTVTLGPEADEYLKAAANELRKSEERENLTIEGKVVQLKSDSPPWEDEPNDPHTIVVAWLDNEGRSIRTRMALPPEDYLRACEAHMKGASISVTGRLQVRGKYSRLVGPRDFRLGDQQGLFET